MVSTFVLAAAIAAAGMVASRVQARAVAAVAGPPASIEKR